MIKASFGLSETGSVRNENQDSFLLDVENGIVAVADGLGGLPNGERASSLTLEILRRKILESPNHPLGELITEVNQEVRKIGYDLDASGFGTTLTMARFRPDRNMLQIAHVGDSAALVVSGGKVNMLTMEHTVAARMVAEQWQDASEAIPLTAHHTLTQCIGQDLYIDPQVLEVDVHPRDRFFLVTDGVTKAIAGGTLNQSLMAKTSIGQLCQGLTFQIEAAGSPDNYTIVGIEF
ncbi:MAG: PP2C family serine/threonine-protein phosphatase [Puniceicoccaceae bacterium]